MDDDFTTPRAAEPMHHCSFGEGFPNIQPLAEAAELSPKFPGGIQAVLICNGARMLIYAWQSFGLLISYQSDYIQQKKSNSSMSCPLSWNYLDASLTLPKHSRSDDCHQHPPPWPKTPYRHSGGGSGLCSMAPSAILSLCFSSSPSTYQPQQLLTPRRNQTTARRHAAGSTIQPRAIGIRVCPPHPKGREKEGLFL